MIHAKRCVLGRPVAKQLYPIHNLKSYDVGYGPGQLRPNGSRQPESERIILGKLTMRINGLSGQLAS